MMHSKMATLAEFQSRARDALSGSILRAADYLQRQPDRRESIARTIGVMLLESPTGSGKTLTLGRTLEQVRGRMRERCVWFWFAPFAGLVAQTRVALAEQCPTLRLRDLWSDRDPSLLRDGDVFLQTWASVAKRNRQALTARRDGGDGPVSLDEMLRQLRAEGVRVGVVIDEAHLNFGVNAQAAAAFYLDVLQPDFTLLATATPNDAALADFERLAGVKVESRVRVSRDDVVRAGLNKRGLKLGVISTRGDAAHLIEPEMAALTAGWEQHKRLKLALEARGISLKPLMLVQVEDQKRGEVDPVRRIEQKLIDLGAPRSAIAVHTSGDPDPDFHALAIDETKEVLVFKVAVATGFDAPRAWTLVSVRPNRGKSFGLQIVGRIMRVHPRVRPIHGQDDVLDRGYVFLTNGEEQGGLEQAAAELKAVRSSIESIADELAVIEVGNGAWPQGFSGAASAPKSAEERAERLSALMVAGLAPADAHAFPPHEQDRLIVQGEWRRSLRTASLFDGLADVPTPALATRRRSLPLRSDIELPAALSREILPSPDTWDEAIAQDAARALFRQKETPVAHLNIVRGRVSVSLRELFLEEAAQEEDLQVRLSDARIAEVAQQAFEFNDQLDPRRLKAALLEQFALVCHREGRDFTDADLRRALDLFAMARPRALAEALREAQAAYVQVTSAQPLPELVVEESAELRASRLSAWGVFPPNMNDEERAFAELIDNDTSGRVKWWLRLQESATWSPDPDPAQRPALLPGLRRRRQRPQHAGRRRPGGDQGRRRDRPAPVRRQPDQDPRLPPRLPQGALGGARGRGLDQRRTRHRPRQDHHHREVRGGKSGGGLGGRSDSGGRREVD